MVVRNLQIFLIFGFCSFSSATTTDTPSSNISDAQPCGPKILELKTCNMQDIEDPLHDWFVYRDYRVSCVVEKGYSKSSLEFWWQIENSNGIVNELTKYHGRAGIFFPKHSLDLGKHKLTSFVREVDLTNGTNTTVEATCYLRVISSPPLPDIGGGYRRYHWNATDLKLSAGSSIDPNCESEKCRLNYYWICTDDQNRTTDSSIEFCRTWSATSEEITIPSSAFGGADSIFLHLCVKSPMNETWSQHFIYIELKDTNFPTLQILCIANCVPHNYAFDAHMPHTFKAICIDRCVGDLEHFYWELWFEGFKEPHIDAHRGAKFQVGREQLITVRTGRYEVKISRDGFESQKSAGYLGNMYPWEGTFSFNLVNQTTNSYEVKVDVKCEKFEIIVNTEQIYMLFQDNFLVATSKNRTFQARLAGRNGTKSVMKLLVYEAKTNIEHKILDEPELEVKTIVNDQSNAKEIIKTVTDMFEGKKDGFDPVLKLLEENNVEALSQQLSIIINEARYVGPDNAEYNAFRINFSITILETINKFPFFGTNEARQICGLVYKLVENWIGVKSHPTVAKLAMNLLRNVVIMARDRLSRERLPASRSYYIDQLIDYMVNITEIVVEPNLSVLLPNINYNITTLYPLMDEDVPREDYENYVLPDDVYTAALRDFEEAVANEIAIYRIMGMCEVRTQSKSEGSRSHKTLKLNMITLAEEAQILAGNSYYANDDEDDQDIKSNLVGFTVPKNFAEKRSQRIEMVVTFFKEKNLLWWHQNFDLHTPLAEITFYDKSHKRILRYVEPLVAHFYRNKGGGFEKNIEFVDGTITVPKDLTTWSADTMQHRIAIHRLVVEPGQAAIIYFGNLTADMFFDVVALEGIIPEYDHFAYAKKVSLERKFLFMSASKNPNQTFYYIGILPGKTMLRKTSLVYTRHEAEQTVNYKIGFELPTCVSWVPSGRRWSGEDCSVSDETDPETMKCECKQGTLFGGTYMPRVSRATYPKNFDVYVTPQRCWTIFCWTLAVFAIYCAASVVYVQRRDPKKGVVFLGDNARGDRYAYLIVLRTGTFRMSGTTSNVLVKIKGTKAETKGHVLNLPDPERELLQRGEEDWFVLSTSKYLGDILSATLWVDGVGREDVWYCESLQVHDLQTNKGWHFGVRKWFGLERKEAVCKTNLAPEVKRRMSGRVHAKQSALKEVFKAEGGVHTWNLPERSDNPNYCYMKRLTVLLSTIMLIFTISLLIYGLPVFRVTDGFSYYGHHSYYPVVFLVAIVSSLISFTVNLGIVWLFRSSDIQFPDEGRRRRHMGFQGTKIAWLASATVIFVCITTLVVHGFWLAHVTSLLWQCSVLLAFLITSLLLEYAHILARKYSKTTKNPDARLLHVNAKKVMEDAEQQRKVLCERFGARILRPYMKQLYSSVSVFDVRRRRMKAIARVECVRLLGDLAMSVLYVLLLNYVVFISRVPYSVHSHHEIASTVLGSDSRRTLNVTEAINTYTIYRYVNESVTPVLHANTWYHTWVSSDAGTTSDFANKLLGVARFRQQRIKDEMCPLPGLARRMGQTCAGEFSVFSSVASDFQEFWVPKMVPIEFSKVADYWKYYEDGRPVVGRAQVYPSGGYSGVLGRTLFNSYFNLDYLSKHRWVDAKTRLVCVEFLIYNVNYNVFTSVQLIFEKTPAAYVMHSHSIRTARLLHLGNDMRAWIVFVIFVFHFVLLWFFVMWTFGLVTTFRTFFRNLWNVLDLAVVLLSFVAIFLYNQRESLVGKFVEKLKYSRHNVFVGYDDLFVVEDILTIIATTLTFLAIIRLLKLLRFGRLFLYLRKAIAHAFHTVKYIIMIHFITFFAFACVAFLLFGTHFEHFSALIAGLTTLSIVSLRLSKTFDYKTFSFFYFFCFVSATIFFLALYVAAMFHGVRKARNFYSKRRYIYTWWDFIRDELLYYKDILSVKIRKEHLRAGGELPDNQEEQQKTETNVYPKGPMERYRNTICTSPNRMEAMRNVARLSVRKSLYGSSLSYVMMKSVLLNKLGYNVPKEGDMKTEVCIKERHRGVVTLVEDKTLLEIRDLVEGLFKEKKKKKKGKEVTWIDEVEVEEEEQEVKIQNAEKCIKRFNHICQAMDMILDIFRNLMVVDPDWKFTICECNVEGDKKDK